MSMNKTIQTDDILEDIINNIEKPMYKYEENLNFNELWKDVKLHLLRKDRVIFFLKILLLVTIICFLLLRFAINNIFIIFLISFISSFILTIYILKKDLLKVTTRKLKVLFNDSFLIIKSKDRIIKFYYNELLGIDNKPKFYVIYFNDNYRYIMIDKNQINNKTTDFLENLQTDYKSLTNDKEESEDIWNDIDKYLKKNAEVSCENAITPETINQFCNLKQEKIRFFAYNYFFTLISTSIFSIVIIPLSEFEVSFTLCNFIFFAPISLLIIALYLNKNKIKEYENYLIKIANEIGSNSLKYYFNYNCIFLKSDKKILKLKYKDIKYSLNSKNIIFTKFDFIKFGYKCFILVIDKSKLNENEINYIQKKHI